MIKTFFFVFCRQVGNCQYGAKCTREQKHYHDDHDCTWLVVMENLLKQNCVWIKPAGTFLCHGFGSLYFIFDVCSCYVNFFSFFFLFSGIFLLLFAFFVLTCFFFLIPLKLNDDLMHLNYGKDTLQLNILLLITWFITLVRYMKRFLSSDWLREMQFSGNSVQKRVNSVPRSNKPDWTIPWTF